jgi:hypothetical protein
MRNRQSGNIFAFLFGAVALFGVLAAVSMQLVTGPLRTMTAVTQKNLVESQLFTNARLVVIHAGIQANNGDADSDSFIEPVEYVPNGTGDCNIALVGGGCLPLTLGASLRDPFGRAYGYCVWDHGTVDNGHADGAAAAPYRLNGDTDPTHPVIALVSGGRDQTFQTSCLAYDGAGTDGVNRVVGSDDLVFTYTYAEATAASGGLWSIKPTDADTAEIAKDLEVKDNLNNVTVAIDRATGIGDFLGITTDLITAKTGGSLELDGNVGIGTNDPDAPLDIYLNTNVTDPQIAPLPLKINNPAWTPNQLTGIEFWNGGLKTVPTSRIISQMSGNGSGGEKLIFQTQSADAANPNQTMPTTKMTLNPDGGVAIGDGAASTYLNTVAIGYDTTASGYRSVALGASTSATDHYAFASGEGSVASGRWSSALGKATASGLYSFAAGRGTASGSESAAIGIAATASGSNSLAVGYAPLAAGTGSIALGYYPRAETAGEVSLGRFPIQNNGTQADSATSWYDEDIIFEVGNGVSSGSRSNAITILKNGRVGIGTADPLSSLHISDTLTLGDGGAVGAVNIRQGNGTVTGSISTGSQFLDLTGYSGIRFDDNAGDVGFKTLGPAMWDVYSGSNFTFAGYTGFGGEVVMKNRENNSEVFHAYLADAANPRVTFPNAKVGIGSGSTSPRATLDVDGFVRLARYSSEPKACSGADDGAIALTSGARMCVCDDPNGWVEISDRTPCSW